MIVIAIVLILLLFTTLLLSAGQRTDIDTEYPLPSSNSYQRLEARTERNPQFLYRKKQSVITPAEQKFFNTLHRVAGDRYYIFPQMHLTALMTSHTTGKYYKNSYQRINRISVDYVLCDKLTFAPVYAIELDDYTHDRKDRHQRDTMVESILDDVKIPLARFRNVSYLNDIDIINKLKEAKLKYSNPYSN